MACGIFGLLYPAGPAMGHAGACAAASSRGSPAGQPDRGPTPYPYVHVTHIPSPDLHPIPTLSKGPYHMLALIAMVAASIQQGTGRPHRLPPLFFGALNSEVWIFMAKSKMVQITVFLRRVRERFAVHG